ncbi:MAG: hypothetical protein ACJAR9_001050 [Celeribacter sp.]|jgi:hypothetical protein
MGLADPEALQHQRALHSVVERQDRVKIREAIHGMVIERIESGEIQNHADVRAFLQTFEKDVGLEIKPLSGKQVARRAKQDALALAGGKSRPPDKRITMRQIGSTTSAGTFRLEDRIYHEQWTAAEYFAGKAAKQSHIADGRKPRASAERVDELRGAMECAIAARAEKTVSDTESLHAAAKTMCDQTKHQMEADLAELQATTTKTSRALNFTLWKTAMLSGFSLMLGGSATALGSFIVFGMMSLEPQRQAVPLVPLAHNESRVMRGVGGLGTVIVLPAQIETTVCPIGAPRNRICIKKH